ncbi:MAG: hypothetical protein WD601_10660, partial [Pseudohongiellaceae bacterium]
AAVRAEIEIALRDQRVQEMARSTGESILESLRNGQNINALLEAQGLTWREADAVTRNNAEINPQLIDEVFSMSKPADSGTTTRGFTLGSGEYAVVELQSVTLGSLEDMDENEADNIAGFVSQQTGTFDFNAFLTSLENNAEIER